MPVTLSDSRWREIKRFIENASVEWISEDEAAKLLSITKRSLQNRVYDGTISTECYTKAVTGQRVYNKQKLLNLTQ